MSTWDAAFWLKANFTKNNGLPEFFLKGDYPADKHDQAEEDYKNTVKLLLDTTEDENLKCWCQMTILSNFLALELTQTKTYWRVLIRDELNVLQEDNVRNIIFRHMTAHDYRKRPAPEAVEVTDAPSNTRRRIVVDEQNQHVKFIRQIAEDNFQTYKESTDRENYFTMCGLNNVFELTDSKQGSHLHCADEEQKLQLCNKEFDNLEYEKIGAVDEDLVVLIRQKKFVNLNRALYSQLGKATDHDYTTKKIISHIVETYVHYSNSLLPDVFNKLSEGSIVIKFWSTMIEALFSKSNLIVNWGDTISYGPEKTNRKMDLRILYNLDTASNDVANGEFGRSASENKYFQDKIKLVLNGKSQLNSIVKASHDSSIRVSLLLIQGLQAELYTIRLRDNGLYVLERLKNFRFPKKTTFLSDLNELIDGLSILRALCLETNDKYNDALIEKKRMRDFSSNSSCCSSCCLPWLREVVMPPVTEKTN